MFINASIFQMLSQCCLFWFSGQGECMRVGAGNSVPSTRAVAGLQEPSARPKGKRRHARGRCFRVKLNRFGSNTENATTQRHSRSVAQWVFALSEAHPNLDTQHSYHSKRLVRLVVLYW